MSQGFYSLRSEGEAKPVSEPISELVNESALVSESIIRHKPEPERKPDPYP